MVGSGDNNEALAYGSDVTAVVSNGIPILTLPQAGNLVIQHGLGAGSQTQVVTDSSDNSAGDVDSAVDAGTGAAFASWQSNAGSGGDFMRQVAPTVGPAQKVPGPVRNELVISGRDQGPGIFAAYSQDGSHVRLQRYGGGSVAVGKLRGGGISKLATATGLDGRIWVMWGNDSGVALTRSNRAVTKFEHVQHVKPHSTTLHRLSGDGRLGPLDLLVDQIPSSSGSIPPPGTFHARILPVLSVSASIKGGHKLKVAVKDAGDAVPGAKVKALGKKKKTNAKGVATLTLPGSLPKRVKVTVKASGYRRAKKIVKS